VGHALHNASEETTASTKHVTNQLLGFALNSAQDKPMPDSVWCFLEPELVITELDPEELDSPELVKLDFTELDCSEPDALELDCSELDAIEPECSELDSLELDFPRDDAESDSELETDGIGQVPPFEIDLPQKL